MPRAISNLKTSVAGVRGVIGETLTPSLIANFASAFGQWTGPGPVVIGTDTRPSSMMVQEAVVAGLLAVGCEPLLYGVLPTPTIQLMVSRLQAVGGIAITASHNPESWNALKFISGRGMFLSPSESRELHNIYHQSRADYVSEDRLRPVRRLSDGFSLHELRIHEVVDVEAIRAAKLRVAVDCANGAGAPFAPDFLRRLGCQVIALNTETDGIFRRMPEPVPESLGDLCAAVRDHGCAVGFAQDPDADRLVLVDDLGQALNENYTLALCAAHVLRSRPKGPVTATVATSDLLRDICTQEGVAYHLTKVGEIHVSTTMLENGSVIGGETNGGVIWPAVHPCRDSFAGMALILEMLAKGGRCLSQQVASLPHRCQGARKIEMSVEAGNALVRRLRDLYASSQPLLLDGIRINFPRGWVLIRPSNTEPVLRILADAARPEELSEMMAEIEARIQP